MVVLFIFLLYFSAPAYAAFSKLEVYTNVIGSNLTSVRPWLFTWGELGLIKICGKNAAASMPSSPPARRSRVIPGSCDCRTSSSTPT